MKEQTLILIKPDGLVKSLTGNILTRLSETKLEIAAAKMVCVSPELATEHYKHLKDQPFFGELITYLQGQLHGRYKVLALVYWGEDAIGKVRALAGATNPEEAEPTSIRGSYGRITSKGVYENVIHASSNAEEAEREIKLWFQPSEIILDAYPVKTITQTSVQQKVWA
ncbi:MAG: nucleoside-diphosphate kinase [Candidatus Omnitrophica bacterium]|nr:nucleoside-diphosphate kinase [Candidatus Omnitrophota bacterium]